MINQDEQVLYLMDNINKLEDCLKQNISYALKVKIENLTFKIRILLQNLENCRHEDISKYYEEIDNILMMLENWPIMFHPVIVGKTNLQYKRDGFHIEDS